MNITSISFFFYITSVLIFNLFFFSPLCWHVKMVCPSDYLIFEHGLVWLCLFLNTFLERNPFFYLSTDIRKLSIGLWKGLLFAVFSVRVKRLKYVLQMYLFKKAQSENAFRIICFYSLGQLLMPAKISSCLSLRKIILVNFICYIFLFKIS